jgi:choice-of-anchor B domain-containing protein
MQKAILILSFFVATNLYGQLNTALRSRVVYQQEINDVWGWTDSTGIEYALVGTTTGVSIVSLENPENPQHVAFVPGDYSVWRDLKTYGNYAYVVADQPGSDDGLLVIDLSNLPQSVETYNWTPTLPGFAILKNCHNLYIDENGICYLAGCNIAGGGVIILDVTQEDGLPEFITTGPSIYAHDVFALNQKMYASEIFQGQLGIYDLSNRERITRLAGITTPYTFTHNAWTTSDGHYVFTTDEKANAPVGAYDITDLNNIQRIDIFRPPLTLNTNVIPHNVHVKDNYLFISYYTDGGVIVDASIPDHLIEVGQYDTELQITQGYNGAWGMYPFFKSGLLLISDINNGLYVVEAQLKRAARIKGVVVDESTQTPIFGAQINIVGSPNTVQTNFSGQFKSGSADGMTTQMIVSKEGYLPDTSTIELVNGQVLEANIALKNSTSVARHTLFDDQKWSLTPNPASDFFTIQWERPLSQPNRYIIEMSTPSGKILKTTDVQSAINLRNMPVGTYSIQIKDLKTGETSEAKTLIKY